MTLPFIITYGDRAIPAFEVVRKDRRDTRTRRVSSPMRTIPKNTAQQAQNAIAPALHNDDRPGMMGLRAIAGI
jgi:hypothetical protein